MLGRVETSIAVLLLSGFFTAVEADVYQCTDANGIPRYTNVKSEAKGCKALNILPPDNVSKDSLPPDATVAISPAVAELLWLTAARAEADPSARILALEDWARGNQATLDTVTHALVDPDEAVRIRAQHLLEEALTRR